MARRAAAVLLAWAALAPAHLARADDHIVLEPLDASSSLPEKMLVFMPGGKVPNQNYVATAQAIQRGAPNVKLWVAIPAVFQRLCIISCTSKAICAPLHQSVESALSLAQSKGWARGDDSRDLFLAGHSLGGICSNTLFQAYSGGSSIPYAALVVMGSYVDQTGGHNVANYPVPVFTLNGELDGGSARPGKTALWWRQYLQVAATKGNDYADANKPVVVLPQVNHSNFCPGWDVEGDLPAEVDTPTAVERIGQTVGAFLEVQTDGVSQDAKSAALGRIRQLLDFTHNLLQPVLAALDMEVLAADTRVSDEGASGLCTAAQAAIAGLPASDAARLVTMDGYYSSRSMFDACNPMWNKDDSSLDVRTCSRADYDSDSQNTGNFISAHQVGCKMASAERVAQELGTAVPSPLPDCRAANQKTLEVVESMAPAASLDRYKRSGRSICLNADSTSGSLQLQETAACLSVTSPAELGAFDAQDDASGTLACELLSPARALDWIMTDSLKPFQGARAAELLV